MKKLFSVQQVRDFLGYEQDEPILRLIRCGIIKAHNISAGSRRATWRISEDAFNEFLAARTFVPARVSEPTRRTRRQVSRNMYEAFNSPRLVSLQTAGAAIEKHTRKGLQQ